VFESTNNQYYSLKGKMCPGMRANVLIRSALRIPASTVQAARFLMETQPIQSTMYLKMQNVVVHF